MIYTLTEGIMWMSIVFAILLVIKLINDYYAKNYQHRIISHSFSAIMDTIILLIASAYIFNEQLFYNYFVVIGVLGVALTLRWILFDLFFNLMNGDKIFHVGKSSELDVFLSRFKPFYRPLIKIIPILIYWGLFYAIYELIQIK